jgi:hypothetical protein
MSRIVLTIQPYDLNNAHLQQLIKPEIMDIQYLLMQCAKTQMQQGIQARECRCHSQGHSPTHEKHSGGVIESGNKMRLQISSHNVYSVKGVDLLSTA